MTLTFDRDTPWYGCVWKIASWEPFSHIWKVFPSLTVSMTSFPCPPPPVDLSVSLLRGVRVEDWKPAADIWARTCVAAEAGVTRQEALHSHRWLTFICNCPMFPWGRWHIKHKRFSAMRFFRLIFVSLHANQHLFTSTYSKGSKHPDPVLRFSKNVPSRPASTTVSPSLPGEGDGSWFRQLA